MFDVSRFLGGNFLTHCDLPQPFQIWSIRTVDQQMVGQGQAAEQKVCLGFLEFPGKPLAANKTNLKRVASLYGVDGSQWIGQPVLIYRTTTTYGGEVTMCVRLCGPQQSPPEPPCDPQGHPVPFQPVPTAQGPVSAPQADGPSPWEGQQDPPDV